MTTAHSILIGVGLVTGESVCSVNSIFRLIAEAAGLIVAARSGPMA